MAAKNTGGMEGTGTTGSTTPAKKSGSTAREQGAAKSDGASKKQAAGATAKKSAARSASKTATKTAAKKSGGATKKSAGRAGTKTAGGGTPDLRSDLRDFVRQNPQGWGHDEWTGLVGQLRDRGHKGNDDQIGSALERERLSMKLEEMEGVGPQRVKTLVDRFGTLYSLRHADADEVAREAKIPRELAEKITRRFQ